MEMIELAELTDTPVSTLRYFESLNLFTAVVTLAGQRVYDEQSLRQIRFIRKAQRLGFSLDEIQQLMLRSRAGQTPNPMLRQLLQHKITELDDRMAEIQNLRRSLSMTLQRLDKHPERAYEPLDDLAWIDRI